MLNLQHKPAEALAVFGQLDKVIAKWEPNRRQVFEINGARIYSLYAGGQIDAGIAAAQALLKREIARVGERHFDTAAARGTLAIGLMKAGKNAEAVREFRAAIPVLMASARENADDDDTTVVAAKSNRLQDIVEAYIALLDRQRGDGDVALETFALADAIRGRSVQQALAASSARMLAKDPALAEVVRKEQDLAKQINAQLGTLNNVLSLASHERDEKGVQSLRASINTLRANRDRLRADIAKRFPSYADLIDPKPPSVEQIKATLKPGEALLSFYFGREASFVWAVPKDGAVAFAAIPATSGDLESKIRKLREALEPQAQSIADIPPFDLKLAHELYSLLLKPVEAGWKPSKQLIVVTNGALGLLAAVAAADRSRGDQGHRDAVRRLSLRSVACPHPCGDDGAVGGGAADVAADSRELGRARADDRLRRSVLQQGADAGSGGRQGHRRRNSGRDGDHSRRAAQAARLAATRRRRQRRTGVAAAAAGHGRRIALDRARARSRSFEGGAAWREGERERGQGRWTCRATRSSCSRRMASCPAS